VGVDPPSGAGHGGTVGNTFLDVNKKYHVDKKYKIDDCI
jgi:hypothetical protein